MEKGESSAQPPLIGANDNLAPPIPSAHVDAALKLIARAIGRQIARDMMQVREATNDNEAIDGMDDP